MSAGRLDSDFAKAKASAMIANGFPQWQDLTTDEIRGFAARDPVVILPLAAIEQHGAHLPLSTDLDIGLGLLRAAAAWFPESPAVLQLAAMALGTSMEHEDFPGTLSLAPETALATITAYGAGLARTGVRRLILANSHGGNTQVMDLAGLRLRRDHGLLVVKCSYFALPLPDGLQLPAEEIRHGIHGGAVETAMMLHLAPEAVRRERVGDAVSLGARLAQDAGLLNVGGSVSFAWLTQDLHPSGAVGNSQLADEALGARLVEHYGRMIAQVIRETAGFPLDALRLAPRWDEANPARE